MRLPAFPLLNRPSAMGATPLEMPYPSLIWALGSLCALHQRTFDAALIIREFPAAEGEPASEGMLIQAAKALGFRAQAVSISAKKVSGFPMPLVVALHDSESPSTVKLGIITAATQEKVVLFEAGRTEPSPLNLSDLQGQLSGQAWMFAPEVAAANDADAAAGISQVFGFRWFIPELVRHRKVWRDVLLASLALQIVALTTPLFTQAIIDKVVTHRTESTLIAIGLAHART